MSTTASPTITLTPELERFLNSMVGSGLYRSVTEAIQEGLMLLKERESTLAMSRDEIRGQIAEGLAQADRGELLDGEEVFQELEERFGVAFDASWPSSGRPCVGWHRCPAWDTSANHFEIPTMATSSASSSERDESPE